jgi:hypothetical protein
MNNKNKQHLILEGLSQNYSYSASINKGLSETLFLNFPNTIPAVKPSLEPQSILKPKISTGFLHQIVVFIYLTINLKQP